MEDVDHYQNQNRPIKGSVGSLEQEYETNTKDKSGYGDGTQRQKINRFGHTTGLSDTHIAQHVGKSSAKQRRESCKFQRVEDVSCKTYSVGIPEYVGYVLERK